ncbi:Ig-like domain-containing protein [Tardiphaga sp. 839_C3_N1_4]|uniref:Ig-like domain-containing protein n=1 Tax=Tardiphaga sp. 839_C3_N1_4 TaxID=3240761 RepID=UPI003F1E92BC
MRLLTVVAWALILSSGQGQAQETMTDREQMLTRSTKAGQEVGIGFAVRWNKNCEPVLPRLSIVTPPSHGSLCGRTITVTIRKNLVTDDQTCVGRRTRALQVIYTPRADFSGPDTVDYMIDWRRFRTRTHVDIQIAPATEPLAKPTNIETAPGKPGDMIVPCAPLMSAAPNYRETI